MIDSRKVSQCRIPVAAAPAAIQTMTAGTDEVMESTNMDGSKTYLFIINGVVTGVRPCMLSKERIASFS